MSITAQTPDWKTLDELIFANQKLALLKALRSELGCPLAEALELFSDRYATLRVEQADRFAITHSDYWEGFYS